MIDLKIDPQPDDESCGPTCLHAIYRHEGLQVDLRQLSAEVERSLSGGTLAAMLGKHALQQGFEVSIYINNLSIFDPTWFIRNKANPALLYKKLEEQLRFKPDPALQQACKAYMEYLSSGGIVLFKTLNVSLLKHFFDQKIPIITGLNATYLYRCARELYIDGKATFDDVRGTPCGHFVVLCGYDTHHKLVVVADPHRENPISGNNYYKVSSHRLINSILLGVTSYDANLLIIRPKEISAL